MLDAGNMRRTIRLARRVRENDSDYKRTMPRVTSVPAGRRADRLTYVRVRAVIVRLRRRALRELHLNFRGET